LVCDIRLLTRPRRSGARLRSTVATLAPSNSSSVWESHFQLAMPLQQQHQVADERVQPLRADVSGRFPDHFQRLLGLGPVSPPPHRTDQPWLPPLAASQQRRGVLAVIAGGQAEGGQDLARLLAAGRRVAVYPFLGKFVPSPDAHRFLPQRARISLVSFGETRSRGNHAPTVRFLLRECGVARREPGPARLAKGLLAVRRAGVDYAAFGRRSDPELVEACNGAGFSHIGTPEHAVKFIETLQAGYLAEHKEEIVAGRQASRAHAATSADALFRLPATLS
jgi:hypothetical protein